MPEQPPARPAARPAAVPRLRPFTPQEKERLAAALDALLRQWAHAWQLLQQAVRTTARQLRALADQLNQASRPPGRPAWVSPYGPPPRRHL